MDVPSPAQDALAQPTRARLFTLLGSLRRPAPTEELADQVGLHPNGVRVHLERLAEDGLVTRHRERRSRGRPRDSWSISPDAPPGGDAPTAYVELARWLVRTLTTVHARARDVEAGLAARSAASCPRETRLRSRSSASTTCWRRSGSSPSASRWLLTA